MSSHTSGYDEWEEYHWDSGSDTDETNLCTAEPEIRNSLLDTDGLMRDYCRDKIEEIGRGGCSAWTSNISGCLTHMFCSCCYGGQQVASIQKSLVTLFYEDYDRNPNFINYTHGDTVCIRSCVCCMLTGLHEYVNAYYTYETTGANPLLAIFCTPCVLAGTQQVLEDEVNNRT